MPKKPYLQRRGSDKQELQRLVKNFNAKISRLEKTQPDISEMLPQKVKASDYTDLVKNKNDFDIVARSLKSFTKRGSEKIVESEIRGSTTKWQKSEDTKTLNRTINRFNKKLDKIATNENIDFLPLKIDKKEDLKEIKNLDDFKHFVSRHTSFLKEGAETVVSSKRGAKALQWEIDEFYKNETEENKRREKRLEELGRKPVTIANEETGVTRAEMGKIKENEVKPSTKNFDNMSMEEWKRANRLFEKKMHSSYSEQIKLNKLIHYCVGLENQGLGDVVEIMKRVPLDKFIELLDTDEIADFDFIYDPVHLEVKREKLLQLWERHATNENEHLIEYYGVNNRGEQILLRL